jgi:endo-1,4-beta-mannosidase
METDERFLLGVNYWPRRKAMYWWSDFDLGEVRDEFAVIRGLGLDVVRLFLLWDDFQPAPDAVSPACLDRLVAVCGVAADAGLGLDVTFFTGHMSGPNWAPGWLLDGDAAPAGRLVVSGGRAVTRGYRNPYGDPTALAAERLLLSEVVGRLKDHPAVWAWNLGNEPDLFAEPAGPAAGERWVQEMTRHIKEIDPRHPVTCGLHVASLLRDNGLRVGDVFRATDFAVMHAYPMYLDWARGPLDPDLVPFTCALTTALCGKPTLMEEFGGCTAPPGQPSQEWRWTSYGRPRTQYMASEEDLAGYLEAVLPRLVDVGATGAFTWCFADYAPDLWDRPPCAETQSKHERHFGLVRPDGSLKPHAEVVRRFAASRPRFRWPPRRAVQHAPAADEYYAAPRDHCVRLYEAYLAE